MTNDNLVLNQDYGVSKASTIFLSFTSREYTSTGFRGSKVKSLVKQSDVGIR
jgi:hypothetical protein